MSDNNNFDPPLKELEPQKRHKNNEHNKKLNEEAQPNFKKQKNLEKLQKESLNLKEEPVLSDNITAKYTQIKSTTDEIEQLKAQIEEEQIKCDEVDILIEQMHKAIINEKKMHGGANATNENCNQVQKQIQILENRLDKANQKFNETIAYNKSLRQVIENLRKEKVIFDVIYNKMEKELHDKRINMAGIISNANKAYEGRDRAQEELSKRLQDAESERKSYQETFYKLNENVEKGKPMEDSLKSKEVKKKAAIELDSGTKHPEEPLTAKVDQSVWGSKGSIQSITKKIQYYDETISKIQAATSITDIDQFVQSYTQAEEKVFI